MTPRKDTDWTESMLVAKSYNLIPGDYQDERMGENYICIQISNNEVIGNKSFVNIVIHVNCCALAQYHFGLQIY